MARVSYSQYSMWSQCPQKYKLSYIDSLSSDEGNIHTIFGTAMHETIQFYLEVFYNLTKKEANEIDLPALLNENLRKEFKRIHEDANEFVTTPEEMAEFYADGVAILEWFKKPKNQAKFFLKKGWELVAIERPINLKLRENINVQGFIDIVLRDRYGKLTIIDLKTSTRGWNKYQKASQQKRNQLLLYKLWYSKQYGVPTSDINVEFHIMRRKMPDQELEFSIPRISRFVPPNGKPSLNKAERDFDFFLDSVFNTDGSYTDGPYPKLPSSLCKWCEFYKVHCSGKVD